MELLGNLVFKSFHVLVKPTSPNIEHAQQSTILTGMNSRCLGESQEPGSVYSQVEFNGVEVLYGIL